MLGRPQLTLLLLLASYLSGCVDARATANPEFAGEAPERTALDVGSAEVRDALRFVMTEVKRLSNTYRYATLLSCHSAAAGEANFDGRNLFLDVEFDMLPSRSRSQPNQPTRHDIIVFKDEKDVITGMALDEFPEVKLREQPDPDV